MYLRGLSTFLTIVGLGQLLNPCLQGQNQHPKIETSEYESYRWQDIKLPKYFLAQIAAAVEFAFVNGAAREISGRDFFHFHLLASCEIPGGGNTIRLIRSSTTLLFHTQEDISYGHEAMMKRNIVFANGRLSFVRPSDDQIKKGSYTVYIYDLGLCSLDQGYLVDITNLDVKRLKIRKENIILFDGKKIFVGFTRSD